MSHTVSRAIDREGQRPRGSLTLSKIEKGNSVLPCLVMRVLADGDEVGRRATSADEGYNRNYQVDVKQRGRSCLRMSCYAVLVGTTWIKLSSQWVSCGRTTSLTRTEKPEYAPKQERAPRRESGTKFGRRLRRRVVERSQEDAAVRWSPQKMQISWSMWADKLVSKG